MGVSREDPTVRPPPLAPARYIARSAFMVALLALGAFAVVYLLAGLRQINQWETALRFTLGRYTGRLQPGLTLYLPGIQELKRIDTRTKNRDLLRQMVITRDNVTTMVDAVVYYRVIDP